MLAKALLSASVSAPPAVYVEDVFSTFLYTGNGSTQTITNGIDLSGKGGLVWLKNRTASYGENHALYDSARGIGSNLVYKDLSTDSTNGQIDRSTVGLSALNSDGFTVISSNNQFNNSAYTYASWTFRKAPKFFDVVTYTGTGSNRTIAHSLGSVPGSIIVKRTDTTAAWAVYHRSLANTQYLVLNTTAAAATGATWWNSTTPTSSVFSVGTDASVNASGGTYVAYLFAHNAGGFGTAGTDSVVSCGTYTGNGSASGPVINLGYEPQWVMVKAASTTSDWFMADIMRGQGVDGSTSQQLKANTSGAEGSSNFIAINSTGFQLTATVADKNGSGQTYIYIAIRRGPMKTPTVGTEVFSANAVNVSAGVKITTGFPVDWQINYYRSFAANYNSINFNRLTGVSSNSTNSGQCLWTAKTDAEATFAGTLGWDNTGYQQTGNLWPNIDNIYWNFRRAPGFFDVVAYTGTGSNTQTVAHNLTVVPELLILKGRSAGSGDDMYWRTDVKNNDGKYSYFISTTGLSSNAAALLTDFPVNVNGTIATSAFFTPYSLTASSPYGGYTASQTYIAYLFATCPGVSKVGSYTGTGTTKQIDCGFTAGARFVLIKRTDSTGDWYTYDTARGIISGNDPFLLINSTAAENTSTDYIDPLSSGFEISSTAPAAINANGGSFIFLAIS